MPAHPTRYPEKTIKLPTMNECRTFFDRLTTEAKKDAEKRQFHLAEAKRALPWAFNTARMDTRLAQEITLLGHRKVVATLRLCVKDARSRGGHTGYGAIWPYAVKRFFTAKKLEAFTADGRIVLGEAVWRDDELPGYLEKMTTWNSRQPPGFWAIIAYITLDGGRIWEPPQPELFPLK